MLVCLFVAILHCKVSMVLSGDLDAPLTDLCRSGGLYPVNPASGKLSWDYTLSTAGCVVESGKHGSQTPPAARRNKSIFAHSPYGLTM